MKKKFKLDDTNINNDYKNKDDIEIMKVDNFIQDSEKINNNFYIKWMIFSYIFGNYILFDFEITL